MTYFPFAKCSFIANVLFAFLFAFSSVLSAADAPQDRSPVDLVLAKDGSWLISANETANSISLVRTSDGQVLDEVSCGDHPTDIAMTGDGMILVAANWSGELTGFRVENEKLSRTGFIELGLDPHGIAVSPSADVAYVSLMATGEVAEVDLKTFELVRKFPVGAWPKYLTVSKDGKRLAVGLSGSGQIAVFDTETGKPLYEEPLANGLNLGHMITSNDGLHTYFTWMVYRTNPITISNIQRGWVLASRIGRVRLDGPAYREAISLDVPRKAVADPHGIAISNNGQRLLASSSGTHELLLYRLRDLPFIGTGGPGDLIEPKLARDRDRFSRIEVGGRPMGLVISDDNDTAYVANYLRNSIQVVDLSARKMVNEFALGGDPEPQTLERYGMTVFYDAERSLDQWYSCHSCHQNGGTNSKAMDTWNDGTGLTVKTVLPLYQVTETHPWTWHGWQTDLDEAMHKSITSTMKGKAPNKRDKKALIAYLSVLKEPPNPFQQSDQATAQSVARGKEIFHSAKAACADCHSGAHFSDGQVHDVGLGSSDDYYDGYNTPSLRGAYRKVRWLHNGRAKTLHRLINELHSPDKVSGHGTLSEQESTDLIEYLKTL